MAPQISNQRGDILIELAARSEKLASSKGVQILKPHLPGLQVNGVAGGYPLTYGNQHSIIWVPVTSPYSASALSNYVFASETPNGHNIMDDYVQVPQTTTSRRASTAVVQYKAGRSRHPGSLHSPARYTPYAHPGSRVSLPTPTSPNEDPSKPHPAVAAEDVCLGSDRRLKKTRMEGLAKPAQILKVQNTVSKSEQAPVVASLYKVEPIRGIELRETEDKWIITAHLDPVFDTKDLCILLVHDTSACCNPDLITRESIDNSDGEYYNIKAENHYPVVPVFSTAGSAITNIAVYIELIKVIDNSSPKQTLNSIAVVPLRSSAAVYGTLDSGKVENGSVDLTITKHKG